MEEPDTKTLSKLKTANLRKSRANANNLCFCGRVTITAIALFATTVIILALLPFNPYGRRQTSRKPRNITTECNNSEQFQNQLYNLAERIHNLLEEQHVKHFLCYDSLWGALEIRGLLPWAKRVEMCLEKESLAKRSMKDWIDDFRDANLSIVYCWKRGAYIIKDPAFEGGSVELILFKEEATSRNLMRTGWQHYRWRPDCRDLSLHCFHPYLIDNPPLRKKLFGDVRLPVPHFNEVIQRYLYPDSWKDGSQGSKPKNC